jgi:large subunit ribosomal protein L9
MEVILRQDVVDLGRAGEIVTVKEGYGRNYLIPRGLAYAASAGNKARIAAEAKRR